MRKRLYLSRKNKVIAGVCGGIAEFLDVDPTLIRIVWVILSLISFGFMFFIYVLCWAIMPLPME